MLLSPSPPDNEKETKMKTKRSEYQTIYYTMYNLDDLDGMLWHDEKYNGDISDFHEEMRKHLIKDIEKHYPKAAICEDETAESHFKSGSPYIPQEFYDDAFWRALESTKDKFPERFFLKKGDNVKAIFYDLGKFDPGDPTTAELIFIGKRAEQLLQMALHKAYPNADIFGENKYARGADIKPRYGHDWRWCSDQWYRDAIDSARAEFTSMKTKKVKSGSVAHT